MDPRHIARVRHQAGQVGLQHLQLGTTQYHTLFMVERAPEVQDPGTGLWVTATDPGTGQPYDPAEVVTPITYARVTLGGAERIGEGGASQRVGDAVASHIRTDLWPLARLLAAIGFRIDSADPEAGELYQVLEGGVTERGHNTYELTLTRMSQPPAGG